MMQAESIDATVLVVDDEADMRHAVRAALRYTVMRVLEAADAEAALTAVRAHAPDVIILDLGLPDQPGLQLCRTLRTFTLAPILVLTARHIESDKVALLTAGADDYVTKPFGSPELAARVAALIRRSRTARPLESVTILADGLALDFRTRRASRDGRDVRLTPIEWAILRALTRDPGRVYTHQQLFDAAWGRQFGDARQYLRVHVTNLRRKIERNPTDPRIIVTESGAGYRFTTMSVPVADAV